MQRMLRLDNPRAHQAASLMKGEILKPEQSHCRKPQYPPSDPFFKKIRVKYKGKE